VHQATTVVVVLDADGQVILETIVATEAAAIIRLVESLSGPLEVTFEETTQADWLYEVVRHYVSKVVVCDPRRNKLLAEGSKGDKPDARKLAELLRGNLLRSVYHGHETNRKLKELVRAYETTKSDLTRVMSRLKAIFRGRAIAAPGRQVYQNSKREQWLNQLSEPGLRQRASWLYEQLDHLRGLHRTTKKAMLAEAEQYQAAKLLRTIPQIGAIRAAQLVAIVDTPYRFRTKRQFWSYSGLAVVTHTSSEYEIKNGRLQRRSKPVATRGLNPNCNRQLKNLFIGAARGAGRSGCYREYVERATKNGVRPEMTHLTLARKIATLALTVWKKGEGFDVKKLNSK